MVIQKTPELIECLSKHGVKFVIVGGVAAIAHGATTFTLDLDVAAEFSVENMARLLAALRPLAPSFAVGGRNRPFPKEPAELASFRNVYINTALGRLDVLGDSPPLPQFALLLADAVDIELHGHPCKLMSLGQLLLVKETLARPKDLLVAAELRAIRERLADR